MASRGAELEALIKAPQILIIPDGLRRLFGTPGGEVRLVEKGDIPIGGRNFGMGSSRPAARSLRNLGLACLVTESINGLFFRNCAKFPFPAMECPGVAAAFEEGETADVSFEYATATNTRTGVSLTGRAIPPELRTIITAGELFSLLAQQGYIASRASA